MWQHGFASPRVGLKHAVGKELKEKLKTKHLPQQQRQSREISRKSYTQDYAERALKKPLVCRVTEDVHLE